MNYNNLNLDKKDILIVDDTPANLRVLSAMLTSNGYRVRKALNGEMALTACQTILPDLILLDIMMPEIDGYEVCRRLKQSENTNKIPIIFLSALDDVLDKVQAFNVGGVDYITKPFQSEEVLIRVKNQLILREAELEIINLNNILEEKVKERTKQLEIANKELQQEINERKQLEKQLLHLALHDPLTDLPNRTLFMKRLEEAINHAKNQPDYQFAVLFLDCDRFKIVNDSLGHLVGDELLVAIGHRLQGTLNESDIIARLGGDEFAILLENISDITQAAKVAQRIIQELSIPFQVAKYEVFTNASIGIIIANKNTEKPEYILRDADAAMYRAKALGKGCYYVFDPQMHQQAIKTLELENDLRRAIEKEEFIVYYQPIVCLNTGKINGFEALARWQHPTRGLVSPLKFIPLAEETGLISSIDTLVLQKSCQQLQNWKKSYQELTVSVNISVRQFCQPNLLEKVNDSIKKNKLNYQNLKLEITESAIMENKNSAQKILNELKSLGIESSIDDFGTGYSSLSYLHDLPVNYLKIDKSFVRRMQGNISEKKVLVPGIISMAHTMGMKTIAEGIETPEQLAILRNLSCDRGQGFLFSKPLENKLAKELLDSSPQW